MRGATRTPGYWGSHYRQVTGGDVDYVTATTAEINMVILGASVGRTPSAATHTHGHHARRRDRPTGIRIVVNAGVNTEACREAIMEFAAPAWRSDRDRGRGDQMSRSTRRGAGVSPATSHRRDCDHRRALRGARVSGARLIAGRLTRAQIDRACDRRGRRAGPMIHEFAERDRLDASAGTVAGHILECGATGGTTASRSPAGARRAGSYPDRRDDESGDLPTKHEETAGLVTKSITEQLLYEIGDPKAYMTPG
jgi:hypothetical protein